MVLSSFAIVFNNTSYTAAFTGYKPSVTFTLASLRDSTPTVTAARLGLTPSKKNRTVKVLLTSTRNLAKGKGKTYEVYFRLNRYVNKTNATFIATNWPKELKMPKVGEPTNLAVLGTEYA